METMRGLNNLINDHAMCLSKRVHNMFNLDSSSNKTQAVLTSIILFAINKQYKTEIRNTCMQQPPPPPPASLS